MEYDPTLFEGSNHPYYYQQKKQLEYNRKKYVYDTYYATKINNKINYIKSQFDNIKYNHERLIKTNRPTEIYSRTEDLGNGRRRVYPLWINDCLAKKCDCKKQLLILKESYNDCCKKIVK